MMASAVKSELQSTITKPVGTQGLSLEALLYSQLRGATRGLQQESAVRWAVEQTARFLQTMDAGQEQLHLRWLLRHVHHTGADVRLTAHGADELGHRPGPYPAFRWLWREILAFKWKAPQHINILEISAFLTELRRRARDPLQHGQRFFSVVDSLVSYFVLSKGRSSSKRLNRLCRRTAAVSLSSGLMPISLWTISKWNFSDHASRRFET